MKRSIISMLLPGLFLLIAAQTCDWGPLAFPERGIRSFSVDPQRVCVGQEVTISWDSEWGVRGGDLELSATPPIFSSHHVDYTGSEQVAVFEPVEIRLYGADEDVDDSRSAKVEVVPLEGGDYYLSLVPECFAGGTPEWLYTLSPQKWPDHMTITSLENAVNREILLTHDGKTERLGPYEASTTWNGAPVGGLYVLLARLDDDEACPGTVTDRLTISPPILGIHITYGCN